MSTVAVVGALNRDVTIPVEHLPGPGETVLAVGPVVSGHGGKGGNQASAAAALGSDVHMVARVGDDAASAGTLADLASRRVRTDLVLGTPGVPTGTATIVVDPSGDNLIIVDPGANAFLRPSDVICGQVRAASVLLLQLEVPVSAVAAAANCASGTVVLNPAPARLLDRDLLDRVNVLVPNRHELARLAGVPSLPALDDVVEAAVGLPGHFDVVVTLGADGALVVDRRRWTASLVPAPAVEVVDATGAGDAFCGALAVALARQVALVEAAALAVAGASISVTAAGARGRLATWEELAALKPIAVAQEWSPPPGASRPWRTT